MNLDVWIQDAHRQKATHLIVVMDTFDYEAYPVVVLPGESLEEKIEKYRASSMQQIKEVRELLNGAGSKDVTKAYTITTYSEKDIAIKKDRDRVWRLIKDEQDIMYFKDQLYNAIFGEEK